jgi:outer membrane protein assembly factor BamB
LGQAGRGTPYLAADALYLTVDDAVLRLTLAGDLVWRQPLGAATTALAVDSRAAELRLYVATADGSVVAFTADGSIVWRASVGQRVISAPALAGDTLLVGDAEGALTKLDARSGAIDWRRALVRRIPSPTLNPDTPLIAAPPLVGDDGTIYLSGRDGTLTALDAAGNVRWRYDSGSDITATAARSADGSLYVGLMDQRMVAVGPDGQPRWEVRVRGAVRSTPSRGPDGALYISTVGGRVYALTPKAGAERLP